MNKKGIFLRKEVVLLILILIITLRLMGLCSFKKGMDKEGSEIGWKEKTVKPEETNQKRDELLEDLIGEIQNKPSLQKDSLWENSRIPDFFPIEEDLIISQKFTSRHPAIDLVVIKGTKVYAAAAGAVRFSSYDQYLGNLVIIDHLNDYESYYGHLNQILVHKNDTVKKGTLIGTAGSSGNSTATHLHFAVKKSGEYLDPQRLWEKNENR